MKALHVIASVILWMVAAIGVLCGGLWIANQVGWVQPLIVTSGSMEPTIATGDLLFAVSTPVEQLEVGDVATLAEDSGRLITHRVVAVEQEGGEYVVQMEGDANGIPDAAPYRIDAGESVWHPVVTVPGAGGVVEAVGRPAVAVPALIALTALIGLTLLPPAKDRHPRLREA